MPQPSEQDAPGVPSDRAKNHGPIASEPLQYLVGSWTLHNMPLLAVSCTDSLNAWLRAEVHATRQVPPDDAGTKHHP